MNIATFHEVYPKYSRPYLVQRLKKPSDVTFGTKRVDQVFCFGGGGSGLTDEAWELLKPCFEFDYMGAAEFEFGALPKSLGPFSQAKLTTLTLTIKQKDVMQHWRRKQSKDLAKRGKRHEDLPPPAKEEHEVYVICRTGDEAFVEDAIRTFAKDEHKIDPKEAVRLDRALDPIDEWDSQICGWYELRNGFFFFTDKAMFERTKKLFFGEESDAKKAGT